MFRLMGRLVDVEAYSGDFTDKTTGEAIAYSGQRLHILAGREVIRVKVPKDGPHSDVDHLTPGDVVDVAVSVQANAGARGAYLTATYAGDWSEQPSVGLSLVG